MWWTCSVLCIHFKELPHDIIIVGQIVCNNIQLLEQWHWSEKSKEYSVKHGEKSSTHH